MKTSFKNLLALGIVIAVLTLGAAYGSAAPTQLRTYRNFDAGLEFDYPYNYVMHETLAKDGSLIKVLIGEMRLGKTEWLLSVERVPMSAYPKEMFDQKTVPFLQFATDVARYHCEFSTSKSATYCPDVADITRFESANGVEGFEFALNEIREEFLANGTSNTFKSVRTPVYAFDISAGNTVKVLLIEPRELAFASPVGMEIFKDVVKTFVLNAKGVKVTEKP